MLTRRYVNEISHDEINPYMFHVAENMPQEISNVDALYKNNTANLVNSNLGKNNGSQSSVGIVLTLAIFFISVLNIHYTCFVMVVAHRTSI